MTPFRLVPRVLHLGTGPYLVVCAWYQTLDVAAMACWPGVLAENCRSAEGSVTPRLPLESPFGVW